MWVSHNHVCLVPSSISISENEEQEPEDRIFVGDIWRCDDCLQNHRLYSTLTDTPNNQLILMFYGMGY